MLPIFDEGHITIDEANTLDGGETADILTEIVHCGSLGGLNVLLETPTKRQSEPSVRAVRRVPIVWLDSFWTAEISKSRRSGVFDIVQSVTML